jgi:hypothetical protein
MRQVKNKYKEIIEKHHCGSNELADYNEILKYNPLSDDDLAYFDDVIRKASSSQIDYDGFSDMGGIDIAAILLAEVKYLRKHS